MQAVQRRLPLLGALVLLLQLALDEGLKRDDALKLASRLGRGKLVFLVQYNHACARLLAQHDATLCDSWVTERWCVAWGPTCTEAMPTLPEHSQRRHCDRRSGRRRGGAPNI